MSRAFVAAAGDGITVGDSVWVDADEDGIQDDSAGGLAGVVVGIYYPVGSALIATTTTDASGMYTFTQAAHTILPATPYTIRIDTAQSGLDGYLPTSADATDDDLDSDGQPGSGTFANYVEASFVSPAVDQQLDTIDFGFTIAPGAKQVAIGDTVWRDSDGEGDQDEVDAGIANVVVGLYFPVGSTLIATTTTDADGVYLFTDAAHGILANTPYIVRIDTTQAALQATTPTVANATDDAFDSDGEIGSGAFAVYVKATVTAPARGDSELDLDFGFVPDDEPKSVEIGDTVWVDSDRDGDQDEIGTGIPNVVVELYPSIGGSLVATTTTDANGHYRFTKALHNILADTPYVIRIDTAQDALIDLAPTVANATDDDSDSDGVASVAAGFETFVEISARTPILGEIDLSHDFGFVTSKVRLGNFVWLEDDGDGEAGNPADREPLAGVVVTAVAAAGDVYSATTDASGLYTMTVPIDTTYTVTVAAPEGYMSSTVPNNPGDNQNHGSSFVVQIGQADELTIDFSFTPIPADWGDLPDGSAVDRDDNGPRHYAAVGGATVWLGENPPDYELDGMQNVDALGDDLDSDDEDGFSRFSGIVAGGVMNTYLLVNGSADSADIGYWIDFNANGSFDDPDDYFAFIDNADTGATAYIEHPVPIPLSVDGTTGHPRVRIRIYPADFASLAEHSNVVPTGSATDGEVEDHLLTFDPTAVTLQDVGVPSAETTPLRVLIVLIVNITLWFAVARRQRLR